MIAEIAKPNPKTFLDIGIGYGMNGAGIRNWLDSGYVKRFKLHITGVEIFEDYRSDIWKAYDEIIIDDIRTKIHDLPAYDAIIMTDVIEHMDPEEGQALIKELIQRTKKILLISTPAVWMIQGAVYGNENETHISLWEPKNFEDLGMEILDNGAPGFLGSQMIIATYKK
jgi:2-polyprenyl-3-methyl-5-hydroxy-6-metoxy-1,4-benzoquinol methylase